jgi:glycosyltransferase involved in cell wall biosynthesis
MSRPRVSAIVVFLNEERFLAEGVESVFAQSYEDWELLLVDDGSTDASPAIAASIAKREPHRIRVLSHPGRENRGISASRNLGLAHARGEFIAFLDADDKWLPNKLAEQVEICDRYPEAGVVYGRTRIWNSWSGDSKESDFFYDLGVEPDRLYPPPRLFELLLENKAQNPTQCNAFIRRSLFDRVGGFEESLRGLFEDTAFYSKAFIEAPGYVDSREWAWYRQHPASCSATSAVTGEDRRARLRYLRWLNAYLGNHGGIDPRFRRAVQREIWDLRGRAAKTTVRRLIRGRRRP